MNVSKLLKHPFIAGVTPFRYEVKDYSAEIRLKYEKEKEKEKVKQLAMKNEYIIDNHNKIIVPQNLAYRSPITTTQTTPSHIEVKKLSRDTTPQNELNDKKIIDNTNINTTHRPSGEMIAVRVPRKIKRHIENIK